LTAYLACWRVRRAGVACCLPLCPRAAGADFGSALRDDAAVVGWAALGLELGFAVADLDLRGLVVGAEGLLPALRIRTWGAGPAVGVGCAGVSVGCVWTPRRRAIAVVRLRKNITAP
jgi:hypothetical protein